MNEDTIRRVNKKFYERHEPDIDRTYLEFLIEYIKLNYVEN